MIRLFSFSCLLLLLCSSCRKADDTNGLKIEVTRYQVLVDKQKHHLSYEPFLEDPSRERYNVYRYDKRRFMRLHSIRGFDEIYGAGGAYYLLEIREEATRNVEDGGSTYYLERIISKQDSLVDNPFTRN